MTLFDTHSKNRKRKRHAIKLPSRDDGEKSAARGFKIWIGAYALVLGAALAVVAVNSAHSAPTPTPAISPMSAQPLLLSPDDMQSGGLLFKSKEAGKYVEAPKVGTDIKIDISGPVARAIVTQKFLNPSDAWIEGIYVFPLPDTAAVDQLKMRIGDRIIEGKIKPKEEARQIYETAKQEGKKASLLEQHRPNLFTNAVANIGPHDSVTVQIEYQQAIPRKGEDFSLRVPSLWPPATIHWQSLSSLSSTLNRTRARILADGRALIPFLIGRKLPARCLIRKKTARAIPLRSASSFTPASLLRMSSATITTSSSSRKADKP